MKTLLMLLTLALLFIASPMTAVNFAVQPQIETQLSLERTEADGSLRKNVPEIKTVETTHPSAPTGVEGAFESVWIEHDVKVKGAKGMQIHAKFTVKNGLKVPCLMVAYFFNKDRAPLKTESRYTQYQDSDGNVSVNTTFTPRFDPSEFADQKLFLPYSALNLKGSGVHELKLYLILMGKGSKFAQSSWYNFRITKD